MLNIIWPFFILISFIYSIINGSVEEVNNSIFNAAQQSVELTITFFGTICLWSGIIKIAQSTSIMKLMNKILKPFINYLFPEYKNNEKMKQEISMNMITNILGLGNAATPAGLKTMKLLQERNKSKEKLSNEMAIFIVLNTASIQVIPTTVIAIRNSLGSANPTNILFPVWVATISAAVAAITSAKIILRKS